MGDFFKWMLALLVVLLLIIAGLAYMGGDVEITAKKDSQKNQTDQNSQQFRVDDMEKPSSDLIPKLERDSLIQVDTNLVIEDSNDDFALLELPINKFAEIDKYARACPDSLETNIPQLATYLQQITTSDLEKARVIYTWLTDNISYNDSAYNSGKYGDNSAKGVLINKTSVCEGFSNLYVELGKEMNLDVKKVTGYSKGFGYQRGQPLNRADHAWNMIKLDDEWRVFDATWGQGSGERINGKLKSTKKFDDYWFNTDPYEAIFSHMPQEDSFITISPKPNLQDFSNLPQISRGYFNLGFNGEETYQLAINDPTAKFPTCYKIETYVEARMAPKEEVLYLNETYSFEFYIPKGLKLVIFTDLGGKINSENSTFFQQDQGVFTLIYTPSMVGEVKISVKLDQNGDSYSTILSYLVENKNQLYDI